MCRPHKLYFMSHNVATEYIQIYSLFSCFLPVFSAALIHSFEMRDIQYSTFLLINAGNIDDLHLVVK